MNNIVLIGMRGSGKSTIAQILAKELSFQRLELDDLLVLKAKASIPDIVKAHGWDYFRDLESEIVTEVSKSHNAVISTGGGVVLRSVNMEALKKRGTIVYLEASVNTLLRRIGDDANRPSLTNNVTTRAEEIVLILNERQPLYQQWADIVINTDTLSAEETVNQILTSIRRPAQ